MLFLRALLQLSALWFFVFVSGMAPATVRAGIMFSLFVAARLFHRDGHPFNTLCVAALISICAQPMIIFDVGFQYSYAAMVGIVAFMPTLRNIVADVNPYSNGKYVVLIAHSVGKQLWDLLSLTLSAQVAVLPLTLYYFNQMPTYFALSNLLIVPFAGLLLVTALCVALLSFWPWASNLAALLLNGELNIVDGIVARVAALPHSVATVSYFSLPMLLLAYAAITVAYLWLRQYAAAKH